MIINIALCDDEQESLDILKKNIVLGYRHAWYFGTGDCQKAA